MTAPNSPSVADPVPTNGPTAKPHASLLAKNWKWRTNWGSHPFDCMQNYKCLFYLLNLLQPCYVQGPWNVDRVLIPINALTLVLWLKRLPSFWPCNRSANVMSSRPFLLSIPIEIVTAICQARIVPPYNCPRLCALYTVYQVPLSVLCSGCQ